MTHVFTAMLPKKYSRRKQFFVKMSFCHFCDFFRQKMSSPNSTSSTKSIFLNKKDRFDYFYDYLTVKMCLKRMHGNFIKI